MKSSGRKTFPVHRRPLKVQNSEAYFYLNPVILVDKDFKVILTLHASQHI